MPLQPVNDPNVVAQLEQGSQQPAAGPQPVQDPAILAQLNGQPPPQQPPQQDDKALGPWASAVVRPIAEGAGALPMMAADAGVAAGHYANQGLSAMGLKTYPELEMSLPSESFKKALDTYTSAPQGIIGKGAEMVSSMLFGGLTNPEGIGLKLYGAVPDASKVPEAAGAVAGQGRAAVIKEAQQAGFKMPPEDAVGANLASISGKAKLERQLSVRNDDRVQELTNLALGHPEGHSLSYEALDQIRAVEAAPYEKFAAVPQIKTDEELMKDISQAGSDFQKIDRAYPREPGEGPAPGGPDASQIESLKGRYFQPQQSGRDMLGAIKQLRKDSSTNLKDYDPAKNALGVVQRQVADAFEERFARFAETEMKQPQLASQLRAARVKIAQTYAVQDAMNRSTGRVSATELARLYQNGAPLTGELQTIARAALAAPKAFKSVDKIGREGEFSVVDFLIAAGAYLHNPSLAAAVVARPAIRKFLETSMAQKMARPTIAGQAVSQAAPGMVAPAMQQGPSTIQ
jgi:hypothetical protein